ncbi:MAG: hypothetical protein V3R90_14390 [Limibaculum sp.]
MTAQLTELEEEHGGDEGALASVSNKTDALIAWQEALVAAWQSMNARAYGRYTEALAKETAEVERLAELTAEPRIQALTNTKGKITQAIINARIKEGPDVGERALLERYKATSAAIKEAKKSAKELQQAATDKITDRLAADPENEDQAELRVINTYLDLTNRISEIKAAIKKDKAALDATAYSQWPRPVRSSRA